MKILPAKKEAAGPFVGPWNRLFRDFLADDFNGFPAIPESALAVDLCETPESLVVKAEIPGIDAKELEISVLNDTLFIKGEKKEEKEEKGKTWHRIERSYGSFSRAVALPTSVNSEKVEAVAKDGILTITLPKREEAKTKKIPVVVQ